METPARSNHPSWLGLVLQVVGGLFVATGISLGLAASSGGNLVVAHVNPHPVVFLAAVSALTLGGTCFLVGPGFTKGRPWAPWIGALAALVSIAAVASLAVGLTALDWEWTWILLTGLVGAALLLLVIYRSCHRQAAVATAGNDTWANNMVRIPVGAPELPPGSLALDSRVVKMMEVRAESAYRPGVTDVECLYVMTGDSPGVVDTLHSLATSEVVRAATPNMIRTSIDGTLAVVLKEREGKPPGCWVEVHTHPDRDRAKPSDRDLESWRWKDRFLKEKMPATEVFYGVHAVTNERPGAPTPPHPSGKNKVAWASVCRDHELAVFTGDGRSTETVVS